MRSKGDKQFKNKLGSKLKHHMAGEETQRSDRVDGKLSEARGHRAELNAGHTQLPGSKHEIAAYLRRNPVRRW